MSGSVSGGGGGGGAVPTGSGVRHVTAGVEDAAASHGTAGQIFITNTAGTDAVWSSLANLQAAAGDFIGLGVTPSASGFVRLPQLGSVSRRNNANSGDLPLIIGTATDAIEVGSSSGGSGSLRLYASFVEARCQLSSRLSGGGLSLFASSSGGQCWGVNTPNADAGAVSCGPALAGITSLAYTYANNTTGNGGTTTISSQGSGGGNGNGGLLLLTGGAKNGSGLRGGVQLVFNNTTTEIALELAEVVSGNRVTVLNRLAALTSTQMPANTGDGVTHVANATTNPTANSVGGGILYGNAGAGTWRGTGGTTTAFGPA